MNAYRSIVKGRRRQLGYRAIAALMIPVMLLGTLGSCTTPQTYYRDDGTPYTRDEMDVAETFLAILLVSGLLAVAAADDSEY